MGEVCMPFCKKIVLLNLGPCLDWKKPFVSNYSHAPGLF